ncbi:MAG: hypothetical protein WCS37_13490 [Chloroflexota bacterium]|nr:hypothetical protein [Chloroflexota bacterium]
MFNSTSRHVQNLTKGKGKSRPLALPTNRGSRVGLGGGVLQAEERFHKNSTSDEDVKQYTRPGK